ncbi:MAG: hypothetical protein QG612_248, partial [Pseudomonadota bacterium]|nr:hypothetical protein [Pseudomonadota bacterium]
GGVGVLLVAGLWTRLFPALWQRDRLQDVRFGRESSSGSAS